MSFFSSIKRYFGLTVSMRVGSARKILQQSSITRNESFGWFKGFYWFSTTSLTKKTMTGSDSYVFSFGWYKFFGTQSVKFKLAAAVSDV